MKKILIFFMIAAFLSCETKVVEVPIKGGEAGMAAHYNNKHYNFY